MASRCIPDPAGIAQMLADPRMVMAMHHIAVRIGDRAVLISPVRTGLYKASWRVQSGLRDGKAWARVSNPVHYAVYLEWGTRYMRAQRILHRAVATVIAEP